PGHGGDAASSTCSTTPTACGCLEATTPRSPKSPPATPDRCAPTSASASPSSNATGTRPTSGRSCAGTGSSLRRLLQPGDGDLRMPSRPPTQVVNGTLAVKAMGYHKGPSCEPCCMVA